MSGPKLAALFGFYPYQLGFCGPREREAKRDFRDYVFGCEVSEQRIRGILEKFKAAFPYYRLIAESNGVKDPFDLRVVKAYWLGNELLEGVSLESLQQMLKKKFNRDIEIPARARASHCFHTLFVGSVSGRIKLEGNLLDLCRISWGRVKKQEKRKGKNGLIVEYQPLQSKAGEYSLAEPTEKLVFWDERLVPGVKIGDRAAIHWNHIVHILNSRDLFNLEKYTRMVVESKK